MQTRHLEKGTDSNHIALGLLTTVSIVKLKCLEKSNLILPCEGK